MQEVNSQGAADMPVRPGSTPEAAIHLDDETYQHLVFGEPGIEDMKLIISTAGGETPVAYVRTDTPRTSKYYDSQGNLVDVKRNIFGIDLTPQDFGTVHRSMGAYMLGEDGVVQMVADPANNQRRDSPTT